MKHEVLVVAIDSIEPIEGADRIELSHIGGYKSIVEKGKYAPGSLVVYIPAGSVVPQGLLKLMGLENKLAGAARNRVKEVKMRGVYSEGLVLSLDTASYFLSGGDPEVISGWKFLPGEDFAEALGITKYEPKIPVHMAGRVKPFPYTLKYDIENIKKHNHSFVEGEQVYISEKIHGTYLQAGYVSVPNEETGETVKQFYVTSKGLAEKGIIIDLTEDTNLYVSTAKKYGLDMALESISRLFFGADVYIMGEVFGNGVQDLTYYGDGHYFQAFDIALRNEKEGLSYIGPEYFRMLCMAARLPTVNYLYVGSFSEQVVKQYTSGMETLSGASKHIREGVVVRPAIERHERGVGRLLLKSVSEDYLTRKGNVTEYQ